MKTSRLLQILVITLASSCFHEPDAATVGHSILFTGQNTLSGQAASRKLEVYKDQQSFDAALSEFVVTIAQQTIDFTTKQVALLSMGQRPSGGYSISIESAEDANDVLKLSIVHSKPGANCMVTLALTSPFQFVEIDSTKDIIFVERHEVYDCLP